MSRSIQKIFVHGVPGKYGGAGTELHHQIIIWRNPTQPTATRPLALRKDGVWYTYGWDLTKNICELYGQEGYIRTIYRYTPYGTVTAEGDVEQSPRGIGGGLDTSQEVPEGRAANGVAVSQPIQWSSEMHDTELGLVYYNYRYYNPTDGRWTRRDPIGIEGGVHLYGYAENKASYLTDVKGKDIVANFFVGERGHTPFHAAVSVDNWTCKNGNWEKAGVVEYGLQPLFIIDDTFTFSWSLVNLLSSLGLGGYGFINREELKDHPSDWNTWRVSLSREDDMQIINELNSASSSSGTYYHVALRNCQLWVTAVMLKALINK